MNNILVTGSTGQLGSDVVKELLKRGYSTLSPNRSELNLCSEDNIRNYILNSNCEAIVHCAAYTQVDKAEDEKDLCIKINATATKHIAKCAKILDIPMIYISTCLLYTSDNIFNGGNLLSILEKCSKLTEGATIFGYLVDDPKSFGVVEFDDKFNVLSIEEKPEKPKSNYIVPGLYLSLIHIFR